MDEIKKMEEIIEDFVGEILELKVAYESETKMDLTDTVIRSYFEYKKQKDKPKRGC